MMLPPPFSEIATAVQATAFTIKNMSRGQRFGTALAKGAERAISARLVGKWALAYSAAKAAEQKDLKGVICSISAIYTPHIATTIRIADALHNKDFIGAACAWGAANYAKEGLATEGNSFSELATFFNAVDSYNQNGVEGLINFGAASLGDAVGTAAGSRLANHLNENFEIKGAKSIGGEVGAIFEKQLSILFRPMAAPEPPPLEIAWNGERQFSPTAIAPEKSDLTPVDNRSPGYDLVDSNNIEPDIFRTNAFGGEEESKEERELEPKLAELPTVSVGAPEQIHNQTENKSGGLFFSGGPAASTAPAPGTTGKPEELDGFSPMPSSSKTGGNSIPVVAKEEEKKDISGSDILDRAGTAVKRVVVGAIMDASTFISGTAGASETVDAPVVSAPKDYMSPEADIVKGLVLGTNLNLGIEDDIGLPAPDYTGPGVCKAPVKVEAPKIKENFSVSPFTKQVVSHGLAGDLICPAAKNNVKVPMALTLSPKSKEWHPLMGAISAKGKELRIEKDIYGNTRHRDLKTGEFAKNYLPKIPEIDFPEIPLVVLAKGPQQDKTPKQETAYTDLVPRVRLGNDTLNVDVGIRPYASVKAGSKVKNTLDKSSGNISGQAATGINLASVNLNTPYVQSRTDIEVMSASGGAKAGFDISKDGKVKPGLTDNFNKKFVGAKHKTSVQFPAMGTQCDFYAQVGVGSNNTRGFSFQSHKTKDGGSMVLSGSKKKVDVDLKVDCHAITPETIKNKGL
jgi:hypothetical protein